MTILKKPLTWCKTVYLYQNRPSLLGLWARSIFCETHKWDPQLTLEKKIEIENYWKPIVKSFDGQQSKLTDSTAHEGREKFYALSMFPYPSGNLHLGHVRVYTISDVMARYHRSLGKFVIHPMGWDAFGLPAENAAIERGIKPKDWTYSNIDKMKKQLMEFGFSFDWSREFATCDPDYYKWTQFLFLKMYDAGLAFQKKGLVNWDPVDQTVLAHEQIDDSGCSWRSGAKVEKKYLKQWFLRDTTFSESLLQGLQEVDPALWRDVIDIQRNWISSCTGHRIDFTVQLESREKEELPLSVYTETLELIYGVSHLCVKSSNHLCVDLNITTPGAVLPAYAIHPLTGEHLKLVVTEDHLMYPNRDVKLAIPCISESDKATADRLQLPYRNVLDTSNNVLIDSKELNGLPRHEAVEIVRKKAKDLGIGGERISEQLHDWLISRQRYWGTPIPMIHCGTCGTVPVPYKDLPVTLPDSDELISKGGQSPLAMNKDWLNVPCPRCGSPAQRETDTMDTFVDSSWYFLRYLDPNNDNLPFDPAVVNKYMPVDLYVGGKEHALLHLYFARFFSHFLHSIGMLSSKEPFKNLLTQGMVKSESYRVSKTGKYIPKDLVDFSGQSPVEKSTGEGLVVEFEKMSKSKYNGVNPEDVLSEYGVDSTRLCILSNVSPQSERNWSEIVYKGVINWQNKIWTLVTNIRKYHETNSSSRQEGNMTEKDLTDWEKQIDETRNHIINKVTHEFDNTFHINAAISRLHTYVSWLGKVPAGAQGTKAYERALGDLIVMIGVMAPHFASELWTGLADVATFQTHDWKSSVLNQPWPKLDQDFLMPLTYSVNNVAIADIGVAYKDLSSLTTELAMDLVMKDSTFIDQFSQYTVQKYSFFHDKHKASLKLTIPEYKFPIASETTAQLRKQEKKLSKQKKKLYSI
ncbi:probable leucine--tRNA ligase, mitochondrial [Biomphalaria glabrata]|uniref:leucine--tRNA ligase n=1 Tax=Biomphalaria glabrata TaxID=6526 RepID=A0A9W3AVZ8_BIOGL|nr:probable leucine--tRNA ligase, mitochondrial [Biomphalaria glabrata]